MEQTITVTITIKFWRLKLATFKTTLVFTVNPAALGVTTTTFTETVGAPATGSVGPTGGQPPYTVAADDVSTLPPGITIDAQGNVQGSATTPGTFSVPITVTDSAQ